MRRSLVLSLATLMLTMTMAPGPANATQAPRAPKAPLASVGQVDIIGQGVCNLGTGDYETCVEFEISECPDLPLGDTVRGTVAITGTVNPPDPLYGMVSLFSGEDGTRWWGNGQLPDPLTTFVEELEKEYLVAQVRWWVDEDPLMHHSWLESHTDEAGEIGPQRMACRPATLIQGYLWEQIYKPRLGLIDPGGCGFCLSGNSGGASQIVYSIVHYDLLNPLTHNVDIGGLFPTSGPVHTRIDEGCLEFPAVEWGYDDKAREWIDASYMWNLGDNTGKCSMRDPEPNWAPQWNADSIENLDLVGGDFSYPDTRFEMIVSGTEAEKRTRNHACAYYTKTTAATKRLLVVSGMPHRIQESEAGLQVLYDAIVTGHPLSASCVPPIPPP